MIFYDFEVFKHDWLVVLIKLETHERTVIVNSKNKLQKFYNRYNDDIWIGFNSRHYDQYILKGILCDFNPWLINEYIIIKGLAGYQFSNLLNQIKLINYDIMPNPPIGLKTLEGFMGHNIKESDVDFLVDRKLTKEEIEQTIVYCTHDVEETIEVFVERIDTFNASLALINAFNFPIFDIGKTDSQLTAKILDAKWTEYNDEWDLFVLPTVKLDKYQFIADWFMDKRNHHYVNADGKRTKLVVDVAGCEHTFAWGGLHGARKKYHKKGLLLHVDVHSYYPSLLIVYNLISRSARHPERYKNVYDTRIKLKAEGKKKEQAPYKKVLNSMSGAMKDKNNALYDPRNNNLMCVNGQLLILDLIEKLEPYCELVQSNTDGLIICIEDTDEAFNKIDDICYEWETRTGMKLGLDVISEIYQKDVNNYLWIDEEGKVECKGVYVKNLNKIDNDLPIVNKALRNYMIDRTSIETTINSCTELMQFQKIVKLSNKYNYVVHNDTRYNYKSYRVFASKDTNDSSLFKVKGTNKYEKFANTATHVFIDNDNICDKLVPAKLDKQWYIDLAYTRLEQFGVVK